MRAQVKLSHLDCYQTDVAVDVETRGGKVLANPGDWIVDGIGQRIVVPSDDFESYFEALDGPNPY
jgi:hypothetical protein